MWGECFLPLPICSAPMFTDIDTHLYPLNILYHKQVQLSVPLNSASHSGTLSSWRGMKEHKITTGWLKMPVM